MIEEGAVIDFYRLLRRAAKRYEIKAEVSDRQGDIRGHFWNAGIQYACENMLKEFAKTFGIGESYGREGGVPRDFKEDTHEESKREDDRGGSAVS